MITFLVMMMRDYDEMSRIYEGLGKSLFPPVTYIPALVRKKWFEEKYSNAIGI